jgi:hypothetical protein
MNTIAKIKANAEAAIDARKTVRERCAEDMGKGLCCKTE